MAGRPARQSDVSPQALNDQLLEFMVQLHRAVEANDGSIAGERDVAILQRKLANQQALVSLQEGDLDAWRKASSTAIEYGTLAIKLAKATLADRVRVLEEAVDDGKRKGRGIAKEASRRRDAKVNP